MKITIDQDTGVFYSGADNQEASAAMILIHGRGADAPGILSLADELDLRNIIYAAPQAENNTWYPYSFLEPVKKNEPYLSNSLSKLNSLVQQFIEDGYPAGKIFLLGFSQGACLTLEYTARNPLSYGGIFALSGGLIGKESGSFNYEGKLEGTPVFLGCSDIDPHIPLDRVNLTEKVFKDLRADVTKKIYSGMGHTIIKDELDYVKKTALLVI